MATSEPETLTLRRVVELCSENTTLFFEKVAHDETYCMELFRRAMVDKVDEAWIYIVQTYEMMVLGWARKKIVGSMTVSPKDCADEAFAKMWVSLQKKRFSDFKTLSAFLEYLRICVHSVIMDRGRELEKFQALRRLDEVDMELGSDDGDYPAELPIGDYKPTDTEVTSRMIAEEIWRWVSGHCKNDREELVMRALFQESLKPAEVIHEYGQYFEDVNEIYRIRRNVMLRLAQDKGNAPGFGY